jgi:hypothetical protein
MSGTTEAQHQASVVLFLMICRYLPMTSRVFTDPALLDF